MVKQLIDITNKQTNNQINLLKITQNLKNKKETILFILNDYFKTTEGKIKLKTTNIK